MALMMCCSAMAASKPPTKAPPSSDTRVDLYLGKILSVNTEFINDKNGGSYFLGISASGKAEGKYAGSNVKGDFSFDANSIKIRFRIASGNLLKNDGFNEELKRCKVSFIEGFASQGSLRMSVGQVLLDSKIKEMIKTKAINFDIDSKMKFNCSEVEAVAKVKSESADEMEAESKHATFALSENKLRIKAEKPQLKTSSVISFHLEIDPAKLLKAEFSSDKKLGQRLIGVYSGSGRGDFGIKDSSVKEFQGRSFKNGKIGNLKISYLFKNVTNEGMQNYVDAFKNFYSTCNLQAESLLSQRQNVRIVISGTQEWQNSKIKSILASKAPTFDLSLDPENEDVHCEMIESK
jgi:hypothetical protein